MDCHSSSSNQLNKLNIKNVYINCATVSFFLLSMEKQIQFAQMQNCFSHANEFNVGLCMDCSVLFHEYGWASGWWTIECVNFTFVHFLEHLDCEGKL